MTDISADTEHKPNRKPRGGLYVTDAELIEIMNVPAKIARRTLAYYDRHPLLGFPKKNPDWGNRRHRQLCLEWLEAEERRLAKVVPSPTKQRTAA